MTAVSRGPGVRFPPPTLFIVGFAAAWLLDHRVLDLPLAASDADRVLILGGAALLASAVTLALWGALTFHRAGTAIYPNRPASSLVRSGPYAVSRNPMYVGMMGAYIGGALLINSIWPMILLPGVLALLTRLVIHREERYLEAEFGEDYLAYKRSVRRFF